MMCCAVLTATVVGSSSDDKFIYTDGPHPRDPFKSVLDRQLRKILPRSIISIFLSDCYLS